MHIRVKKITADRFVYLGTVYPIEGVIHSDPNLIPLSYFINAPDMFEFMRVNYSLDKACIRRIADNAYTIDFRMDIIKKNKRGQLTGHMKRYINKYFSPLQQNRYLTFMSLHEKGSLSQTEQYIYDIELHGRPEATVWDHVKAVLRWFYNCIETYNDYIDMINNETDVKKLAGMSVRDVSFPQYTGG